MGYISKGVANTLIPAKKNTKKDEWRSNACEKSLKKRRKSGLKEVEYI
jgi:hypothetical protein